MKQQKLLNAPKMVEFFQSNPYKWKISKNEREITVDYHQPVDLFIMGFEYGKLIGREVLKNWDVEHLYKLEPDARWYELEISGVKDDGEACETCEDHEAQFFTVYGRCADGRVMALADCATRKQAEQVADCLLRLAKNFNSRPPNHTDKARIS